jgi:DNA gyrase/topoisomerase IV subunit A
MSQEIEPNRWEFTGKVQIIDHNTVKIVELPPGLSLVKFKERLDKFEEEEKIQDYVDKTTETVDITVKFKRGTLKETSEKDLIEFFKLTERKNERIVVLNFEQNAIKQYASAETLLTEFVEWRLGWYTRRYQKYLADCQQEINFINGVLACFDKKLPQRIQQLANKKQLMAEVQTITKNILSEQEQERIVEFATHRWTLESRDEFEKRKTALEQNSQEYTDILADKQKLKNIYIMELEKIKKLF